MTKQEVKREQTLADMANKIAKLDKENELLGKRCNQLLKDKGALEDKVKTLEKTIKGYKKITKWCDNCEQITELETRCNELFLQTCGQAEKIKELEAQIEKMKCCGNCAKRGHICVVEEMQGKLCGKNKDKWELADD